MKQRIIIADLSREAARVGLATLDEPGVEVPPDFSLPQRVFIRREAQGLRTLAGEKTPPGTDAQTLVFKRLHTLLPRVGDAEVRARLAAAMWGAFCESLEGRGWLGGVGYVVAHHLSPQAVLEEFRAAGAGASVRPVGFVHEAAALVLGFLRSPLFTKAFPAARRQTTVCLVAAYDETNVDVACFDYAFERPPRHELVIRDFFHTTCAGLEQSLAGRDWAGAVTYLISVEEEGLAGGALAALVAALQAGLGAEKRRFQTPGAHRLKIIGAAYVAQCCRGRGDPAQQYSVSSAYSLGVQLDRKRFHPVMDGRRTAGSDDFPRRAAQTFSLHGKPGGELRVGLCCGYSGLMGEAIPLGVVAVPADELKRRAAGRPALTVAVTLDTPGSGHFVVESAASGRPLASQSFVLPSLVS